MVRGTAICERCEDAPATEEILRYGDMQVCTPCHDIIEDIWAKHIRVTEPWEMCGDPSNHEWHIYEHPRTDADGLVEIVNVNCPGSTGRFY